MQDTPAAGHSDPVLRAEYPPAHYWRRWTADAPAPAAIEVQGGAGADLAPAAAAVPALAGGSDEAPYRVLVVEDDASQALFAEQVLGGAGIEVALVTAPPDLLPALERFRPDLVLMDLHMPGMSGIEMTALIRAQPEFAPLPVVFLTGDPDPEKQFEVLECGADDFLSKPIRPRHLIAAVHSRIKRARLLARQRFAGEVRNPVTGLHTRAYVLQRIAAALANGSPGGALFIEVQAAGALNERYGYASYEQLLHEVGLRAIALAAPRACARLNDNAFLVVAPEGEAAALEGLAGRLREGIERESFDVDGLPQRLRVVVGHAPLQGAQGFSDAGSVLDAVEQAARAARALPAGVAGYVADPARGDRGLAERLREGLRGGAFELQYQPVVAVAGGEEAQVQVLVRQREADGRLRSAGEFVP
ncbi:MAG: response regulator, partial [Lysobacteraceae bacterium]